MVRKAILMTAAALILSPNQEAAAAPFQLAATLLGDPRGTVSGLEVDVTIDVNTAMTQATWTVDLSPMATANGGAHDDVKLDTFAFNMVGGFGDYLFSGFNPSDWEIVSGNNTPGSGSADFLFRADKDQGNSTDITVSQPLSFVMTKNGGGLFLPVDFLNADDDCVANTMLPAYCGPLGAHLQSLSAPADSGFAIGGYDTTTDDGGQTNEGDPPIPEPTSLLLLGTGLFAAGYLRRKNK